MSIKISVVKAHGIWVISPAGNVETATVDQLRAVLDLVHGPLLINCSELETIDPKGLALLADASANNGTMTFSNTSPT